MQSGSVHLRKEIEELVKDSKNGFAMDMNGENGSLPLFIREAINLGKHRRTLDRYNQSGMNFDAYPIDLVRECYEIMLSRLEKKSKRIDFEGAYTD